MADTQIAFRSTPEMRERLHQLGRRQGRSTETLLEEPIDWRGWLGLRNVLTHGYHRRDSPVIWRATDELRVLVQTSEAWLAKAAET